MEAVWLYAASKGVASIQETLRLIDASGFVWRSFYSANGIRIPNVGNVRPGDELILAFRERGGVKLLRRFRVAIAETPMSESPVFGRIPLPWADEFRCQGFRDDPRLKAIVGIRVKESGPVEGYVAYTNQITLSRFPAAGVPPSRQPETPLNSLALENPGPARDGVHVGIDVGGHALKGFDLCLTEWRDGRLFAVRLERLPHAVPLPRTAELRGSVSAGDLSQFAESTIVSARSTAANLWSRIETFRAAGIHIDSPSAFSRNRFGHGRLCEKWSIDGVVSQSTPSICSGTLHGGDWGWLVYGMVAFSACIHGGDLTLDRWMTDLQNGVFSRFSGRPFVLRECFPTATISVLRAADCQPSLDSALAGCASYPEVQAVMAYLKSGVSKVKRPGQSLYDRVDALVAALGALPHVSPGFREKLNRALQPVILG